MAESFSENHVYQNVSAETRSVDGYSIVTAEVPDLSEGRYKRHHQRIIGGPGTPADGKTIIYADTYTDAPRPTTYAYARHDVDRETFFSRLEEFIGTAIIVDFPELRSRTARCVVQTREDLQQVEFESYFKAVASLKTTPLLFARLYFVFGDVTVEFKKPSLIRNELQFVTRGILSRDIESPLFSFDVSNSDVWLSFLMSVHWARQLFPLSVLRSIVQMTAPATVS